MKRFLVLLALWPAIAHADDKGTCVLESARYLPKIPGLSIQRSKADPRPGNADIRSFYLVTLDVKAAGQRTAYNYWCGIGVDGRPVVIKAGN
jgi:hypothetical protein